MRRIARFDLAPVDPDIEPFVRKSAGGSWYSSKGNMLWTERTSDQAQGEAILSHELSHFVLQYCAELAAQGSPVRYPVYGYVERDDALVDPSLVTRYVRPWSRLVQLERILDGSKVDIGSVRTDSSPGLRLLSAEARPPAGPSVKRFPLADDTTGALATYKWTYERTSKRNLSLGVDAFHTKLSLTVGAELTTQVELQYELRGGHDYTLLRAAEGDGLLWAPVGRPASPA